MKFRVSIGLHAGAFASQQLAFGHLCDTWPEADLEQVEVVPPPFPRLGQWFAPADLPDLPEEDGALLIVSFPGSGIPQAATQRLRPLGRFPGTITRALIPEE